MQTVPDQLITAVKRGDEIPIKTQIIAEWNYNYFIETTVSNSSAPSFNWVENDLYFPLESLTGSMRPKSGIFYAFTNESYTVGSLDKGIPSKRYYTIDKDNDYKYWVSPTISSEFNSNSYDNSLTPAYTITNCQPTVVYDESIKSNKIRVVFNVGALPINWKIYVRVDGVYQQIATNPTINSGTGVCEIWYNGTTWTSTQNLDELIYLEIDAVKVVIDELDSPRSRIQMIEIAAIREVDLTDRIISYEVDMTMDEQDFIHPVGSINSNTGSLDISNYDLEIKYNNSGEFSGLVNAWCQFRIYLDYDLSYWGGTESNKVRIATMYTNEWRHQDESEYQIELFDLMKFLQMKKCPPFLAEDQKLATIMSRILDMIGCDMYKFQADDFDNTAVVKYFWTNGEETVYEALKRLCESHLSAIFVDEFGIIQLLTRDQIANDDDESVWDFLAEDSGLDIADVISVKRNSETIANNVTIKYTKRQAKVDILDPTEQPLTTKLWGADDTIVLRSSALKKNISASGLELFPGQNNSIWISPKEAETWPYKGKVNIDGEILEYYGKGYFVWNYQTDTKIERIVKTDEDKRKYDLETWNSFTGGGVDPGGYKQNGFSGRLRVIKRALNNTSEAAHFSTIGEKWVMMNMWLQNAPAETILLNYGGAGPTGPVDWKAKNPWNRAQSRWTVNDSTLTCNTTDTVGVHHMASVALRKFEGNNNSMREYGTRIRHSSGSAAAGIVFNITDKTTYDDTDFGPASILDAHTAIIVHVMSTEAADSLGRGWTDEIFVELKTNDTWIALPTVRDYSATRGAKWQIDKNKWYDVEVVFKDVVNSVGLPGIWAGIEVWIDGQYVDTFITTIRRHPSPWAGIFSRGPGIVDFDYFYATSTVSNDFSSGDESLFSGYTIQLPAGTNVTELIALPSQSGWNGNITVSFASLESATVNLTAIEDLTSNQTAVYVYRPGIGYIGPPLLPTKLKTKDYGTISLPAQRRKYFNLKYSNIKPGSISINYTSTQPISVCVETSKISGYEYGGVFYNLDPDQSIWDIAKGGYVSKKLKNSLLNWKPEDSYNYDSLGNLYTRSIFFDEFGAIAHEMREFDVEFDISPAKGIQVFLDNEQCQISDIKYHPVRGQFTIVNTSRTNEIVNGTEELSDSESIEHTLMVYGYALEEKGNEEKNVKDDVSILRRGEVKLEIVADWIFDDVQATSLANWIVDHWSVPMDTFEIEAFSNCFTQIGDKVTLKYTKLGITTEMLFIVTEVRRGFDNDAFSSSLTLRRVR